MKGKNDSGPGLRPESDLERGVEEEDTGVNMFN